MAIIVPALLEENNDRLKERLTVIGAISDVQRVQIDILDNTLTPGYTIPPIEIPTLDPRIHWEIHLMVAHSGDYFHEAKRAGFKTVIIQYESSNPEVLVNLAEDARRMGLSLALGIYPQTPIQSIHTMVEHFEQFTLLTVEPGKQGQSIEPHALQRVHELRQVIGIEKTIEVDGGVNEMNIGDIAAAGANFIVAGSAIFGAATRDPLDNFLALQQALA